jgi:hypothetical protein
MPSVDRPYLHEKRRNRHLTEQFTLPPLAPGDFMFPVESDSSLILSRELNREHRSVKCSVSRVPDEEESVSSQVPEDSASLKSADDSVDRNTDARSNSVVHRRS